MNRTRPLPCRRLLAGATLAVALAAGLPRASTAADAASDTLLATFDGGSVTPTEFARAWARLLPTERPPGDGLASKRTFLVRMVERELLAREARKVPVTLTPAEQGELERARAQMLQNGLFARYAAQLPEPTSEDLDRFRRQRAEVAEIRFVTFPDWDMARTWKMRLSSGTPASALDALLRRGGPNAPEADSFRFVVASQIPDTIASVVWSMRPGQFSEVHSFGGHPTLIQLRTYAPNPAGMMSADLTLEENYRRRQYDRMRQQIRLDIAARIGRTFVDEGMDVLLRGYMALPPRNSVDSVSGLPTVRANMPLPVFTAADTGLIVARTKDRELNLVSYLRYWGRIPAFTRPEVRERAVLEALVDRVLLEDELVKLAIAQGLDRDSVVVSELERMREGFVLDHYFAAHIESKVKVTEPALERYFAAQPRGHYDDPETLDGRIIVLDRPELADSVLALARGGASFAELARTQSFDAKSAAEGGKVTGMIRGANRNAGLEEAMFTSPIGEIRGPERTPEGWVIWVVESKTPGRKRTLAEAREWVERDYRIVESDRILTEHLAQLRKKAHARIHEERVTEELGSGLEWD